MTLTTEIGGAFSPEINCIAPDPSYENQKLSYEDLSPVAILCPATFLEEIVTPQHMFLHVLEDCQGPTTAVIDTDNSIDEQPCNNDKDLSLSAFGKIFTESLSLTEQSLGTAELEISDWLAFLSDSGSSTVINPLHVNKTPDHVFSNEAPPDKNSDTLPVELVTDLNSVSGSAGQPDTPVVPSKRQLNTKEVLANSEREIARQVGKLPVIQMDKSKALMGSSLQRTTNEQLVSDHQKGKEVISNYWSATCNEKGTRSTENTASYREYFCSFKQISDSEIQKSSSKNRQDPKMNVSQEVSQNEDRKADQRRRSERIRDKTRISKRNAYGETLLHRAAAAGDLNCVHNLIKAGANVDDKDYAGWTALHEASLEGHYQITEELLKAGADVNARGDEQKTPLQDAVKEGHYKVVALLLHYGADPLFKNEMGRSALDEASHPCMKRLLKCHLARSGRDSVSVKAKKRKKKSTKGGTELHTAARRGNLSLVKALISPGIPVNEQDNAGLSQIEGTLNKVFTEQKADRDALAKKFRASAESFKKGAWREQVANLSSGKKNLLTVHQNRKKLLQKTENYRKTKQVFRASDLEKQIMNPDVVTYAIGVGASVPNENRVEAHLSLENRFSTQECSQYPNNCLAETEANKAAVRSKVVSDSTSASENWIRKYYFYDRSRLTNTMELVALPSNPDASISKTKCSQQKNIDHVAAGGQGNKSLYPTSVTNILNISEAQSAVASNNVCQPGGDCQQVLADEDIHRHVNKKETFQQHQQVMASAPADNFSNLHQRFFQSCGNSFNAESVVTNFTSNKDYPVNFSEKSFQKYGYKKCKQKQRKYARKSTKKLQLIDLLELGRIKPGENVLEFALKEFSWKATLLTNGQIRTNKNKIFQNPVEWVKDLLGSDIYVTWKYAWNKVAYRGTQLSKLVVEDAPVSNDLEIPSQQRELAGFSDQFNSVERLTCFPQFTEIRILRKEEFLPWPVMEKHWNFYRACKDFGF